MTREELKDIVYSQVTEARVATYEMGSLEFLEPIMKAIDQYTQQLRGEVFDEVILEMKRSLDNSPKRNHDPYGQAAFSGKVSMLKLIQYIKKNQNTEK